jgi:hypothetical protein
VNTAGADRADPASPGSAQLQREIQAMRRTEQVENAVQARKVFIGMSAADVVRSWGPPTKVNRTVTASGAREQWIYRGGDKIGDEKYLYIENGVVEAFQDSREAPKASSGSLKVFR